MWVLDYPLEGPTVSMMTPVELEDYSERSNHGEPGYGRDRVLAVRCSEKTLWFEVESLVSLVHQPSSVELEKVVKELWG